jgi:hypothetical protein
LASSPPAILGCVFIEITEVSFFPVFNSADEEAVK